MNDSPLSDRGSNTDLNTISPSIELTRPISLPSHLPVNSISVSSAVSRTVSLTIIYSSSLNSLQLFF